MSSSWYYIMEIGGKLRVITTPPAPSLEVLKLGVPFHLNSKINCTYADVMFYTDNEELAVSYAETFNA